MKIISNKKLIERNGKIGNYTNVAALVSLVGGMLITMLPTIKPDIGGKPEFFMWGGLLGLFVGYVLTQVSFYYINRWGRRPRQDELVAQSLKGLPGDYTLYNFNTPVGHLLLGPAGVWIILPYYQRGTISYAKNRWQQKSGGFMLAYLKLFAQEGLGRPDIDVKIENEELTKAFQKEIEGEIPAINTALIFTDKRAKIEAENAPVPTMPADQLKEFLRKYAAEHPFPPEEIKRLKELLPKEEKKPKKKKGQEEDEG
jgi:hypothetical protein